MVMVLQIQGRIESMMTCEEENDAPMCTSNDNRNHNVVVFETFIQCPIEPHFQGVGF